jgi:hypothetical protein
MVLCFKPRNFFLILLGEDMQSTSKMCSHKSHHDKSQFKFEGDFKRFIQAVKMKGNTGTIANGNFKQSFSTLKLHA